jgi:putative Flp pilus-assembly TadE/G-like protein
MCANYIEGHSLRNARLKSGYGAVIIALGRGCGLANLVSQFRRSRSGNYLILTALLLPVLVGAMGVATDVGVWLYARQSLQGAADSAAFSAATAGNSVNPVTEANAIAASYGFVNGAGGVAVTVHRPPQTGRYISTADAVEVVIQQPQALFFTGMWLSNPPIASARAVAVAGKANGCVLALSNSAGGAITVQGNASVALNGCGLYANSNSSSALTVGGTGSVTALSVGVVGGISGRSNISSERIATGASPIADPYADVSLPPPGPCTKQRTRMVIKSNTTIGPNTYCEGITVHSGATLTLTDGIYYLDRGTLTVNGGASLISNKNVTIVFTSSTGSNWADAKINGGAVVDLRPLTTGPTAGIVFFGDRNMPTDTKFDLEGGASQTLGGAIYLPRGQIKMAGGASVTTGCTQVIGDTIRFTGNSSLAIDCSASGTKPFGITSATLVE